MRIGIDARLYGTKHLGIGRVTQKVIEYIEKMDKENEYFIFLRKDDFDSYQPQNPNFQKVVADYRVYSWQEQLLFPFLLNKYNLDLAHFTHFNVPLFYRRKFIATFHDLIITHYPTSRATMLNPLLYKVKLALYKLIVSNAARKSKRIITVSGFSKDDIVKTLKISSEKVTVVYEGVDVLNLEAANCDEVRRGIGITDDFLFYVGAAYPHKNLEKLILAFDLINKENPDLQLVLVGKDSYFYQRLREFARDNISSEAMSKIVFTGYVDDQKLFCLYGLAKAYVFPSLIEGFGLPPLEAQASDLPVASSNKSCMPEILGNGALFFDPENVGDIKEKLIKITSNENLRQELIENGRTNLQRFSWVKCAEQVHNIYLSQK